MTVKTVFNCGSHDQLGHLRSFDHGSYMAVRVFEGALSRS